MKLRDRFTSPRAYGPRQVAAFDELASPDEQEVRARRAYELVRAFLEAVDVTSR